MAKNQINPDLECSYFITKPNQPSVVINVTEDYVCGYNFAWGDFVVPRANIKKDVKDIEYGKIIRCTRTEDAKGNCKYYIKSCVDAPFVFGNPDKIRANFVQYSLKDFSADQLATFDYLLRSKRNKNR